MKPEAQLLDSLGAERSFKRLFELLRSHGDNVAFVHEGAAGQKCEVSYRQLATRVESAAASLRSALTGDANGKFVGLHSDNTPEWPVLFWGLLMAGYRPLLLDPRASDEGIAELLHQAGAAGVISDRAGSLNTGVPQLTPSQALAGASQPFGQQTLSPWEDHVALCTSGTSAGSKLVVYDGRALLSNVYCGARIAEDSPYLARENTRSLAFVPFFHVLGLLTLFWYTAMGKTTVLLPDRAPSTIAKTCQRYGVNLVYGVPLLWNGLAAKLRAEVSRRSLAARAVFRVLCGLSLLLQWLAGYRGQRFAQSVLFRSLHRKALGTETCLVSAGAPLPSKTARLLIAVGFPLLSGYGMTEAGVITVDVGRSLRSRLRGSVGPLFALTEAKIEPKPDGSPGEISLKGDCLYSFDLVDGMLLQPNRQQGWMPTGDLGRLVDGELFIVGRSKDTIIPATGENVQPEEIEEELGELPDAELASVLGCDFDGRGDAVTLIVQPKSEPAGAELRARWVEQVLQTNQRLAAAKQITRLLLSRAALPVTTSMKVKRQALKTALEAGSWRFEELALGSTSTPTLVAVVASPGFKAELVSMIAECLQLPESAIGDDSHFVYDLGGDSLKLLDLLTRVEMRLGVVTDQQVLKQAWSLRELQRAIEHQLAPTGSSQAPAARPHDVRPVTRIEDDRAFQQLRARLDAAGDFNPYFVAHDSTVRDRSVVDGVSLLNFASYNYLGLSGATPVVAAAQAAAASLGTSASGSRLLTGEKTLYRTLEREIAAWKGVDDALVLVSGHATNVSLLGHFCGAADLILYDALAHNSVEQGARLSAADSRAFRHNDPADLERILRASRERYEKILIVIEGVYSMDGDIAPVPAFVALKHQYGAFLMLDEAHSAGALGKTGKGADEHFGLAPGDIDIRMGTLSKALGSCGGYLAGSTALIEYLRYTLPGFVFSVGISPPNAAAALAALRTLRAEPERVRHLHDNVAAFVSIAQGHGFDTCGAEKSPIIPILVRDEERAFRLCAALRQRGIFVAPAVHPSVPRGAARLRFCVTSEHQLEQIRFALGTLAELYPQPEAPTSTSPLIADAHEPSMALLQ